MVEALEPVRYVKGMTSAERLDKGIQSYPTEDGLIYVSSRALAIGGARWKDIEPSATHREGRERILEVLSVLQNSARRTIHKSVEVYTKTDAFHAFGSQDIIDFFTSRYTELLYVTSPYSSPRNPFRNIWREPLSLEGFEEYPWWKADSSGLIIECGKFRSQFDENTGEWYDPIDPNSNVKRGHSWIAYISSLAKQNRVSINEIAVSTGIHEGHHELGDLLLCLALNFPNTYSAKTDLVMEGYTGFLDHKKPHKDPSITEAKKYIQLFESGDAVSADIRSETFYVISPWIFEKVGERFGVVDNFLEADEGKIIEYHNFLLQKIMELKQKGLVEPNLSGQAQFLISLLEILE